MKTVLNDEIRELLRDREKIMKIMKGNDLITRKMELDFINNDIANACSNMFAEEDKNNEG